jgi:hypothetical protein
LFYFDCILRGYDVKTTTEATGMRPDVLHESICPQDRNECSSMSAFTQHIGSSVSCQQFVQGHLVGTASVLCMTSDNAEASSVVTNNKKPLSYLANLLTLFPDIDNKSCFSDAAACSFPCNDEAALFDSEGYGFDAATFISSHPRNVQF